MSSSKIMWIHKSEAHKYIAPGHVEKGIPIYEFKVTLRDTKPVVWRKISVAGDYTLEQLGRVAGCAIGWIPRYFNFFGPDGEFIRGYIPYMFTESESDAESKTKDETKEPKKKKPKLNVAKEINISKFFNLKDNKTIIMDFGSDGWLHDITLMKIRERDLKWYPKCIDGKNACPPEDCGGPDGYKSLLTALKNPKHKEHQEMKEWMNEMGHKKFDPTKFKVSTVVIGD